MRWGPTCADIGNGGRRHHAVVFRWLLWSAAFVLAGVIKRRRLAARMRCIVRPATLTVFRVPVGQGRQHRQITDHAPAMNGRSTMRGDLLQRTFAIDVLACPDCGGRLRLVATIDAPGVIEKILRHLGLPIDSPTPTPARMSGDLPGFETSGDWVSE